MITIKERLAQLDQKIQEEYRAGRESPKEECNLQYKIRYGTPIGEALRLAQSKRDLLSNEVMLTELKLRNEQRDLDKLKASLEAAELTLSVIENLPSPF